MNKTPELLPKTTFYDEEFERLKPHLLRSKENRIVAATKSFKLFMFIYLSHFITMKPSKMHFEGWKLMQEEDRLLMLWPRGFGKSITASVGYPLWKLLCNPDGLDLKWQKNDIFCISKTASLVEKWVRFQKRELTENQRIKHDFDLRPGEIWRNDEYELYGRGRVRAIGVGAQFRGEHPTDAVLDDIEDREEAKTETNRDKLREWFYGDFLGAMRLERKKKIGIKIIGNCVHPLGLMQELYALDWWTSRKYSVYQEDGITPTWPAYMNDVELQDLRNKIPESVWMAEYMNNPIVSENPVFIRRQFQSYEPGMIRDAGGKKLSLRDMIKVTSLDPAISQRDGADYSAMTTWGIVFDKEPRIFCLEAKRGHWTSPHQITELLASYEKFPGSIQLIEVTGGFRAIYQEYKARLERERLDIRVIDIDPDKDKGVRAHGVTHLFEKGYVYFDFSDKMQCLLMDEMSMFDYTKRKHGRDDFVDSAVHALTYIDNLIRRRQKKSRHEKRPNILWKPQSPIYGKQVACG